MYYTRIKYFPTGGTQHTFYDTPIFTGARKSVSKTEKPPGLSVERGEVLNAKRARKEVYDLARSNAFDWFVTLTMSPERVDRFDYESCVTELMKFTDVLRKAGCQWIIVPEEHEKGGWHFHGLIKGELKLKRATNYHTGEPLSDKNGRPIYNILNYKFGLNTATQIGSPERSSSYLAKYMTKEMRIPKGKKRYWASKSLKRPEVEYDNFSVEKELLVKKISPFVKTMDLKYGTMTICESGELAYGPFYWSEEEVEEDAFVQMSPEYGSKPFEGEQLKIEQNINSCS